jgi:adenine-specific DNA glycosylase
MSGTARVERQKKREIHYALDAREGNVFLVQRARDARLMAGMWELPETTGFVAGAGKKQIPRVARNDKNNVARNDKNSVARDDKKNIARNDNANGGGEAGAPLFSVKHSVTVTDYTVRVWRQAVPDAGAGKWIASRRLGRLAMTGLTRKILLRAGLLD